MSLEERRRKMMEKQHQKNLKVILSMDQDELASWLANLQDHEIEYVEWLVEEVESSLDEMMLEHVGLEEANDLIQKYTLKK